jgi:hypothetical protein
VRGDAPQSRVALSLAGPKTCYVTPVKSSNDEFTHGERKAQGRGFGHGVQLENKSIDVRGRLAAARVTQRRSGGINSPESRDNGNTLASDMPASVASEDEVRQLESAVASQPADPLLQKRSQELLESARHLPGVKPGEFGADAAQCGSGACRIDVPTAVADGVRLLVSNIGDGQGLVMHEPKETPGHLVVYVVPGATLASNGPATAPGAR